MVIWAEREARLFGACVAASVALHAAALALGPRLRHAHVEPPRALSVVLAEFHAPEPRVQEPSAPPPPPKPSIPRPRERSAPVPLPRSVPEPTTATLPAPAAASSEAPTIPEDAPRAPAGPAVAARESVVAPDFRAAYLNNPPPAYPRIARRNGEQGTVMLRVHVSPEGGPTQVELERSSGSDALDSAALETVKNWRFAPARRAGEPVAAWVIVPVVFRLTPGS
jgi:protein TonB